MRPTHRFLARIPLALLPLTLAPLTLDAPAQAAPGGSAAAPPAVQTQTLPGSGVSLYGMQDGRLPRVWYHLYLEAGERYAPLSTQGICATVADLLDRGPGDVPYATYRRDLFRQGTDIRWEAGNRFMIAHVKCQPKELAAVTRLVRHTIERPRLDDETVKVVLGNGVNQRKAMDDTMSSVTFHYGKQKLWDFRPEARQPEGWALTMEHLNGRALAAYVQQRLAHAPAFVASVGPTPPGQVAAAIGPALGDWVQPFAGGRAPYPSPLPGRRLVLIDKPGATDNQIYALSPLPVTLTSKDAAASEVFFAGMGYDLGSRLGKALRVQRGLTYGANSGIRRVEWPQWYAYSFGGITQTPKLLGGFFELFAAAKDGLSPQEVATAKSELLQGYAADMESPAQQLDAVAAAVAQGLPPAYPFDRPRLIAQVTPEDVKRPAALAAGLEHATIVVMGDASKIKDGLAASLPPGTPLEVRSLSDLAMEAMKEGARQVASP